LSVFGWSGYSTSRQHLITQSFRKKFCPVFDLIPVSRPELWRKDFRDPFPAVFDVLNVPQNLIGLVLLEGPKIGIRGGILRCWFSSVKNFRRDIW
jgi:hypothetical protein